MEISPPNPQWHIGDLFTQMLFPSLEFHRQVGKWKSLLEAAHLISSQIRFTSCWYIFPTLRFIENPESSLSLHLNFSRTIQFCLFRPSQFHCWEYHQTFCFAVNTFPSFLCGKRLYTAVWILVYDFIMDGLLNPC